MRKTKLVINSSVGATLHTLIPPYFLGKCYLAYQHDAILPSLNYLLNANALTQWNEHQIFLRNNTQYVQKFHYLCNLKSNAFLKMTDK